MQRKDIQRLYEEYGAYLFKRCKKFLGNDEDAYDALQEVFVRLLRRKGELEESKTLLPWLNRVTTNYCLNVIRYRSYRRYEDAEVLERMVDDGAQLFVVLSERHDLVARLLDRCPDDQQEVAVEYFLEEKNLAEVAETLSISVATVRRRLKAFTERAQREFDRMKRAEKRAQRKR